jgi:hypothetical protein
MLACCNYQIHLLLRIAIAIQVPKIRKPTSGDISAVLSKDAVVRSYRRQTLVSTVTIPRKSKSRKRKAANDRFRKANDWAKSVLRRPGMKELYAKGINDKLSNPHTVAVSDYMQAPEIHYVSLKNHRGAAGDPIRIKATDNFQVTAVEVSITNAKGILLERGQATRYPRKPAMWVYILTAANRHLPGTVIKVIASDRPGNKAEWEEKIGIKQSAD